MEDIQAQMSQLLSSFRQGIQPRGIKLSELSTKDAISSIEARKKGNQLYNEKNNHNRDVHKNILSQYSESVAFAPLDSDELALAYSNRSVLLLHLQRYEDCLTDIERSMRISKSDVLHAKLETRKKKCLELLESSNQESRGKPRSKQYKMGKTSLPSKESNESIGIYKTTGKSRQMPGASEAIVASYNKNVGRHLVATRDIKAGEVVLVERSFSCLPKNTQKYLVCNHCLKSAWNGIPCDYCALGIYCSEECKKEAWEEYHEVECTMLSHMSFVMYEDKGLMNIMMMAVRMIIKAIKIEGLDTILTDAKSDAKGLQRMIIDRVLQHRKFKAFYSLLSHEESIRKLLQRQFLNEAEVIQLLSKHTNIFDAAKHSNDGNLESEVTLQLETILGRLIDIVKVNSFEYNGSVCECFKYGKCECECDSAKGMLFTTSASLINHNCAPNISRMNLPKGKIVFFTITPIKKGEQLYDSYGPTVGLPKKSRQKFLQSNFFFTCKCICCEEDWFGGGLVGGNMTLKEEEKISEKVMDIFEEIYPNQIETPLFLKDMEHWKFDEHQLKMALIFTDLVYKYFKIPVICFRNSVMIRMYIIAAFNQLFGENATIPEGCFNV